MGIKRGHVEERAFGESEKKSIQNWFWFSCN